MSKPQVTPAPKGFEVGGKYREDPVGSWESRGKETSRRKHSRDMGFTPSEVRLKNQLMRQFMKHGDGPGGNSQAWRESELWCRACHNYMRVQGSNLCTRCQKSADEALAEVPHG